MPIFGRMKLRLGRQLGSGATTGEGTQNLLCAYLAVGVLVGLLANTFFGLWWSTRSSHSPSPPSRSRKAWRRGGAKSAPVSARCGTQAGQPAKANRPMNPTKNNAASSGVSSVVSLHQQLLDHQIQQGGGAEGQHRQRSPPEGCRDPAQGGVRTTKCCTPMVIFSRGRRQAATPAPTAAATTGSNTNGKQHQQRGCAHRSNHGQTVEIVLRSAGAGSLTDILPCRGCGHRSTLTSPCGRDGAEPSRPPSAAWIRMGRSPYSP